MARSKSRVRLGLECSECGNRNYTTSKNRATMPKKLSLKKFCNHCQSHTVHVESK